jgi:hypothetical protein
LRQALLIREDLAPDSHHVASSFAHLAHLHEEMEDTDEALACWAKAISIGKAVHGALSPLMVENYHHHADLLFALPDRQVVLASYHGHPPPSPT